MLKLISWNINGLRACLKKPDFQQFLETEQADVICLQEIKAQAEQVETNLFDDYQVVWNSAERKGYSGTLVLSKLPILASRLNFDDQLAANYQLTDRFGQTNEEGRVITVEFDKFYLVTVYTPNSKGDLSRLKLRQQAWDPAFKDHCRALSDHKPVVMAGDFNVAHQAIDLARPAANEGKHGFTKEERAGFGALLEAGFIDSFRHLHPKAEAAYTWWTHWGQARARNVGWRIDYWLLSQSLLPKLKAANIHAQILGSDHCPVSINLQI